MSEGIGNLLIVNGSKKEVAKFKKDAFLDESRAFCFQKLLPIPKDVLAISGGGDISKKEYDWRILNYGNKWGNGFGVIFYETPEEIHYFFNSKNNEADIWSLVEKYKASNVSFVHVFYNHYHDFGPKYGKRTYENKVKLLKDSSRVYVNHYNYDTNIFEEVFSLNLETMLHTPAQLEEIYLKLNLLGQEKELDLINKSFDYVDYQADNKKEGKVIDDTAKDCFYNDHPQQQFLIENARFYNNLFKLEKKLWAKDLKYAKEEIYYSLQINPDDYISKFKNGNSDNINSTIVKDKLSEIEQKDLIPVSKTLLDYLNNFGYKKEIKDFSEQFLDHLISNIDDFLLKYNSSASKESSMEYDEIIAYPEEYWKINFDDFIEDHLMGEDLHGLGNRWASEVKIAEYKKKWEQVPVDLNLISPNDDIKDELHSMFEEAKATGDYDAIKKHIIKQRNYENEVLAKLELCRKKYESGGITFHPKIELGATKAYTILKNGEVSYEE